MTQAQLKLDTTNGKYQLWFADEMICESAWKHTITAKVRNGFYRERGIESFKEEKAGRSGKKQRSMSTAGIIADTVQADYSLEKFSVDERFGMLHDTAVDVALGAHVACVVTGEGGLGKSHTVLEAMKTAGLIDARPFMEAATEELELMPKEGEEAEAEQEPEEEPGPVVLPDNVFVQMKGYTTARGLYETLHQFNGRCIIMDDCDEALFDKAAAMLLKGALDTTPERWIGWSAGRVKKGVPRSFMFTGTVIFITNRDSEDVEQAIRTRVITINMSMTVEQKIERIRTIALSPHYMPHVDKDIIQECLDVIDSLRDRLLDLSMRTMVKAVKQRTMGRSKNWARTFEFSECY